MIILGWLIFVIACAIMIPVVIFAAEVFCASRSSISKHSSATAIPQVRVVVLIPAHNESSNIQKTIQSILPQLKKNDQLLVVADNCTDDTALVAKSCGATVIERKEPHLRGKGYALNYGLHFLEDAPPEVVIIIDADCYVYPNTIERLAVAAMTTQCPVQCLDLMYDAQENQNPMRKIAEFAWIVKNWVRPLGSSQLGIPCNLMGTGMSFPWSIIRKANLAGGNLVEDMKLGIDLALAGYPASFCPTAKVTSPFPTSEKAEKNQRRRWEHGYLATMLTEIPRLIKGAVIRRELGLFWLAADLSVPPLALLAILLIVTFLAALIVATLGSITSPLVLTGCSTIIFMIAVLIAWFRYAKDIISFGSYAFSPRFKQQQAEEERCSPCGARRSLEPSTARADDSACGRFRSRWLAGPGRGCPARSGCRGRCA